jgi:hypothetical protein
MDLLKADLHIDDDFELGDGEVATKVANGDLGKLEVLLKFHFAFKQAIVF